MINLDGTNSDSDLDPKMILQTDLEVDKLRSAHVTEAINIGLSD